jgi:hypothetical protein
MTKSMLYVCILKFTKKKSTKRRMIQEECMDKVIGNNPSQTGTGMPFLPMLSKTSFRA